MFFHALVLHAMQVQQQLEDLKRQEILKNMAKAIPQGHLEQLDSLLSDFANLPERGTQVAGGVLDKCHQAVRILTEMRTASAARETVRIKASLKMWDQLMHPGAQYMLENSKQHVGSPVSIMDGMA